MIAGGIVKTQEESGKRGFSHEHRKHKLVVSSQHKKRQLNVARNEY